MQAVVRDGRGEFRAAGIGTRVDQDGRRFHSNLGEDLARKRPLEAQVVSVRAELEHAERQVVVARVLEWNFPLHEIIQLLVAGFQPGPAWWNVNGSSKMWSHHVDAAIQ